jgi:hypothetical protein
MLTGFNFNPGRRSHHAPTSLVLHKKVRDGIKIYTPPHLRKSTIYIRCLQGKKIRTLVNNGGVWITWDLREGVGTSIGSGVYIGIFKGKTGCFALPVYVAPG